MKEKMKKTSDQTSQPAEVNPDPEGAPAAESAPSLEAPPAEMQETTTEQLESVVESLKAELKETQARADEYLDGWQRSRAEFANFKKRLERDQATANQIATGNVLKRVLEVVDDLDRALKNRPQDGEGAIWAEGIDLIYRKLLSNLEAEGVQVIQADGQFFDPNFHEAISHEDHPDLKSGQVIATVQQGYTLGDRVLRPARVRVAR